MNHSFDFFYDLMSPYSYLASTQLEALAARTGATARWRPFYLPGVMKATGNNGPTAVMAKALHSLKDLNDWAVHYQLPTVKLPPDFPFVAAQADRCALVADEQGLCASFSRAMFHRIWALEQVCSDPAVLASALGEVGLPVEPTLARANSDELKQKLRANTDEAVSRGAFGAPTFFVGDEMFVGNDRLHFVEKALTR